MQDKSNYSKSYYGSRKKEEAMRNRKESGGRIKQEGREGKEGIEGNEGARRNKGNGRRRSQEEEQR